MWELELGSGARRASVPVLVLPDPTFFDVLEDEVGERVDGVVGQGFLRHFLFTIDYPARELHLAAYPDDSHLPPGEYASLGFSLRRDAGLWRTERIEAGSDAAAQGVVAGEIVASIDGVDISELDAAAEVDALIEALSPGAPVELVLDRAGVATALTVEVFDLLPPFTNPGGA